MESEKNNHNIEILPEILRDNGVLRGSSNPTTQEYEGNVSTVNQYGANPINIGINEGNIYVYANTQKATPEYVQDALRYNSNLRHSCPTLNPIIKRANTQKQIIQWVSEPADKNRPKRVGFITGSPGVGKTAFSNLIYQSLAANKEYLVWGIKVDQISFTDIDELSDKMKFGEPLVSVINKIKDNYKRIVIIIDQIDALSLSLSSDRTPLNSIVKFIRDLNSIKGVRVLVSCRDYDIEYDPILSELSSYNQRWRLGDFSRAEVIDILQENGKNTELSEELLRFLGNPQNLTLYLKIRETAITINPLNINSLYDIIWQQDILDYDTRYDGKLNLIPLIKELSESMHNSQRISEPLIRYQSKYNKEIQYLTSCGFLKQEDKLLQFSHQTLFDYVYARSFVESGKSITEELKSHHQGLFIRSQVHSVLLFLRTYDSDNYNQCIKAILSEKNSIKFHIKVLTLTLLAFQSSPSESEIKLLKDKIWGNPILGKVFLNAINSKEWFENVLSLIDSKGGWGKIDPQYPVSIISALLRAFDLQYEWAIDILKKIIHKTDEANRSKILDELKERRTFLPKEILKEFYQFIKAYDRKRFYPKMLEGLVEYDAQFVSSEIIEYLNLFLKKSDIDHCYTFNIGYPWGKLLQQLRASHKEAFLNLSIQLVSNINEATQFEYQLYDIKTDSVYLSPRRGDYKESYHHAAGYLFNQIIDILVEKKQKGEDIAPWIKQLLISQKAPLVCAALNVLIETCDHADETIFEVLSGKRYLTAAPSWVEYYSIQLLKQAFPLFDEKRQKAIIDNIISIESQHDKLKAGFDAKVRMEHGIPLSYQGIDTGTMLNAIPEDLLKKLSPEAWKELERLKRKFKHLDNEMPSKTTSVIGWQSMSEATGAKMNIEEWKKSMIKYNKDDTYDFTTPTLSGQCELFKIEVTANPDKYKQLIIDIFEEEQISMRYLLAGLEGLLASGRIEWASKIADILFNQWLGEDINKTDRNFSLHGYLFAINNVLNTDAVPRIFFDSLKRIVMEADDSHDMERFSGSDMLTFSINTTRGNAAEKLVLCEKYPTYRDEIFDVLEKVAPTASVSTRAAALINLALLNRIDKDRNVVLFKALVHDYNPHLLSMPLHNYNPLVYFVRYAFDQLEEFFEKVVATPASHNTEISILWLAHMNGHVKAIDFIKRIQAANPEAMASLVSFFSNQGYYDSESIEFVTGLIRELPTSKLLAEAVDGYFYHMPLRNIDPMLSKLEELLSAFSYSELVKLSNHGYLDLLKKLSVSQPKLTLHCLNYFIDHTSQEDSNQLNKIVEILISAYNNIRKYNDADDEELLDNAIDHMDSLLMQAAGPSYLNNYINKIDNG